MNYRTDLAIECTDVINLNGEEKGIKVTRRDLDNAKVTIVEILTEEAHEETGKPVGKYITVEVPPFTHDGELLDGRLTAVSHEISRILPKSGTVLVAGLGNDNITPDALGPQTASMLLATRHLNEEVTGDLGLGRLRSVAAAVPGVLGRTGMETAEIIKGLVREISPCAVITVDALACRSFERLGCTVQISDCGIVPGGGVGNSRKEISEKTVGVPVISMGVPTVIDAATLCTDLTNKIRGEEEEGLYEKYHNAGGDMIVTPKDIDMLTKRAARLVALSINCALQPTVAAEDMVTLTF